MAFFLTDIQLKRIEEIAWETGRKKMQALGIQEMELDNPQKQSNFFHDMSNGITSIVNLSRTLQRYLDNEDLSGVKFCSDLLIPLLTHVLPAEITPDTARLAQEIFEKYEMKDASPEEYLKIWAQDPRSKGLGCIDVKNQLTAAIQAAVAGEVLKYLEVIGWQRNPTTEHRL